MAKTLLVTGGLGFIGSNFIHYWNKMYPDDKFIVIDKFGYAGKWENVSPLFTEDNMVCGTTARIPYTTVSFWYNSRGDKIYRLELGGDDSSHLKGIIESNNVDLAINWMSESHVDNSIESPGVFMKNITGMFSLLEACKEFKVPKIIHISTDEVLKHEEPYEGVYCPENWYFNRLPEIIEIDDDYCGPPELKPSSIYSASKASQEMLVHAYRKTWDMDITIVRLTNNYGPRQHVEKLLPKTITNAINDKPIPIYGTGDQWRDWLYVDDSCSALDLIIEKGGRNETFHVSAQQEKQNLQIVNLILDKLGKPVSLIQHIEDRKGHDFSYSLDSSKLRAMGWEPKVSLAEGLDKTIEWYKR